ncbi:MAG TPA: response regulator [Euryarchaeota archaeon]|nr:phosphate regulon transcriptional regulatory protein PhoB [archaeon BMS3Bbin15]HDL15467.1 response regulator [Euryarchaeota archaeon]
MSAKILVVDDEVDIAHLVKKMLEPHGLEVITASNGKDALNILKRLKPDFIFLDLFMPEMSGWEVLVQIKKMYKDIPVSIFTVHPLNESLQRKDFGSIIDYIVKPFSKKDLIETLKQVPGIID